MDGAEAVRYILKNNIEGVIVECGVDSGHFERIWIAELMNAGIKRDIWMYDTFNGLTEPGEFDYTASTASIYKMDANTVHDEWQKRIIDDKTNGWCYTPLHNVQQSLNSTGYDQNLLHYVVGDILQTLLVESNIPDKIAILRLDTDWYESSKIELEKLYDKVVTGGVIIFDDYYHWDGQRRATDDFFNSRGLTYTFNNMNNGKTAAIIKK